MAKKTNPATKSPPVLSFRAIFKRDGRWIVGSSPDVPGAFSQERTLAAARRELAEVVRDFAAHDPRLERKLKTKAPAAIAQEVIVVRWS